MAKLTAVEQDTYDCTIRRLNVYIGIYFRDIREHMRVGRTLGEFILDSAPQWPEDIFKVMNKKMK